MPTSTPSSESPARRTPSSMTHVHLGSDPCIVEVTSIEDGTAVLTLGAHPARAAIFFPDLQALWAALVEAERQAAHLATQPAVDPTVVADDSLAVDEFDQTTWPTCRGCGRKQVHRPGCPVIGGDPTGGAS